MNEVNLRPLSIGELLDKAFQIYRARFFSFLGISALFTLPVALADTITILTQTSSFYTRLFIGPFFTSIAIVFMTRLMSQLYLKQPSSIHQDSFRSYRNVFSIFGVTFLMALIGIYFYTRFSQSLIVGGFTTISMSYWIANYLAILAYFILTARWRMTRSIIVLENQNLLSGLRRCWALTRGWFWRIFGIFCILAVLTSIISGVFSTTAMVFLSLLIPQYSMQGITLIQTLTSTVVGSLSFPLFLALDLVIYYDLRVRKEGFDLLLRADSLS